MAPRGARRRLSADGTLLFLVADAPLVTVGLRIVFVGDGSFVGEVGFAEDAAVTVLAASAELGDAWDICSQ